MKNILVFDIETKLDTKAICKGLRLGPHDPARAREAVGDEFPKLPFHQVIALGRLEAFFDDGAWRVGQIACDSAADLREVEMIAHFDERVAQLKPTLVVYNKNFDLPVIRYRAMIHGLMLRGLPSRKYFARYLNDAEDLCDILANYEARGKLSLDLLSRVLGLPGKPDDVDGGKLEPLIEAGDFATINSYCEQDVVLTYQVWLRHQLYLGNLTPKAHQESLRRLDTYIMCQRPALAHLCLREN